MLEHKEHRTLHHNKKDIKLETQKKLWHIAFSFDEPRPGVITVPADDSEGAKKLFLDMAKGMRNVEVYEIVDAATLPNIQDMLKAQAEAHEAAADDVSIDPDNKKLN